MELPEAWIDCSLYEVADVFLGKTPKKSQYISEGNYKVIKFRDLNSGTVLFSNSKDGFVIEDEAVISTLKEIKEYDVLITSAAHSGENIGKKIAFVQELPVAYKKIFFTGELLNIRASFDVSLSKWLYYYFLSQEGFKQIQKAVFGVHLTTGRAQNMRIVIAPSRQLAHTVANLEKLMAKVDQCKARLEKIPFILKRFRQSILAAACSGELTKEWREENPAKGDISISLKTVGKKRKQQYDALCDEAEKMGKKSPKKPIHFEPIIYDTVYESTHESWFWTSIEDLAAVKKYSLSSGPFGSALGRNDYIQSGIPVVRGQNIQNGEFVLNNFVFISEEKATELERSMGYPGDIVVVAVGSSGSAAIIPDNLPICVLSQNCNKISFDKLLVIPEYMNYFLQIEIAMLQLREKTTDTARPFLSLTNLKSAIAPVPPLEEQQEIVRRVESLFKIADQIEARYEKAKAHVDKLTQSILAKAFRGELVPQDPNDPPASELLERIKAEKKKAESDKKNRKKSSKHRRSAPKVSQVRKVKAA